MRPAFALRRLIALFDRVGELTMYRSKLVILINRLPEPRSPLIDTIRLSINPFAIIRYNPMRLKGNCVVTWLMSRQIGGGLSLLICFGIRLPFFVNLLGWGR